MIIKELNLKSYGKFNNYEITLNDGFNVIYGANEAGKSTVATAVKTLLYPFHKTKDYQYKRKYIPINEKDANIKMKFNIEDNEYVTSLILSKTQAKTVGKTYMEPLNKELVMNSESVAEHFYDVSEEMFDSIFFIKDILAFDNFMTHDKIVHESLSKINASEPIDIDLTGVMTLIENDIKLYKRTTDTGKIEPLKKRLAEIEDEIKTILRVEERVQNAKEKVTDLDKRQKDIKGELEKLNKELENWDKYKEYQENLKNKEIANKIKSLELRKNNLDNMDKKVQKEDFDLIGSWQRKAEVLNDEILKNGERKNEKSVFITSIIALVLSIFAGSFITPWFFGVSLLSIMGFVYFGIIKKKNIKSRELKKELKNIELKIKSKFLEYNVSKIEELYEINAKISQNEIQKKDLTEQIEIFSKQIADFNFKKIDLVLEPKNSYKDLIEAKQKLEKEIREIELLKVELTQQAKLSFSNLSDYDLLLEDKIEIGNRIEKLNEELEILNATYEILNLTKDNYKSSYLPILNREVKEICENLLDVDFTSFYLNDKMEINYEKKEGHNLFSSEHMSSGTKDLIYFAFRVAMYKCAYQEEKKLPLILDDSFIEFDDERFFRVINYLRQNLNTQIFYFTCHKRIFDLKLLENEVTKL